MFQVEVETGRELTYSHLTRVSLSLVQGLRNEGVGDGSIVAIISFNSEESHIFSLATIFLSATLAPLDPSLSVGQFYTLLD